MAEIIKVYKEHLPAVRLIGKRYTDADRGEDGSFAGKWDEWFRNGWNRMLDELGGHSEENSYLGCMSYSERQGFAYWIGMFLPQNTAVPDGFEYADIPEGDVGICWIFGKEKGDNIYGMHDACMSKLADNGMGQFKDDFAGPEDKWFWFFERYNHPRFTTPDENGNIILDYGMYLAKAQ